MKNPVIQAQTDIEWCVAQIDITQRGGNDTKPYSRQEWIACMNRRIAVNKAILKDYNVKERVKG